MRNWRRNLSGPVLVLIGLCLAPVASAGPRVSVVVAKDAPKLERFAADELAAQFRKLFDADVTIGDAIPSEKSALVVIGSPKTNPVLKPIESAWPELSHQGHLLKSMTLKDRPALAVKVVKELEDFAAR